MEEFDNRSVSSCSSSSSPDRDSNTATTTTSSRSTVCIICKDHMESFHMNYGARSCLSCRAFFRRSVQNGREPSFSCKNSTTGIECDVTPKTRRRCKRCRFDLCLKAGMKREYVLGESQIKVRFRRMIRKNKKKENKLTTATTTTSNLAPTTRSSRKGKKKSLRKVKEEVEVVMVKNELLVQEESPSSSPMTNTTTTTTDIPPLTEKTRKRTNSEATAINFALEKLLAEMGGLTRIKREEEDSSADSEFNCSSDVATSFSGSDRFSWRQGEGSCSPPQLLDEDSSGVLQQLGSFSTLPDLKLEEDDLEILLSTSADIWQQQQQQQQQQQVYHSSPEQLLLMNEGHWQQQQQPQQQQQQQQQREESIFVLYYRQAKQRWCDAVRHHFTPTMEFINGLIGLHNRRGFILNKHSLRNHLYGPISEMFRGFSERQPDFLCLSPTDRNSLLAKGTKLFIQYILGRYFSCNQGGEEQMKWLLPNCAGVAVSVQNPVSLPEFNCYLRLFTDPLATLVYVEYARRINQLQFDCNWLLALLCLYGAECILEDAVGVRRNLRFVQSVADERFGYQLNLLGILEILEAMSTSFDRNVMWDEEEEEENIVGMGNSSVGKELLPMNAMEEETLLQMQLARVNEARNRVPFGEELMNEYIMFCFDFPLPKSHFPKCFRTIAERIRYVLKTHEEFNLLSDKDQARIWTSSCFDIVALEVCLQESTNTGIDQVSASCGSTDIDIVSRYIGSSLKGAQVRNLKMRNVEYLQMLDPVTFYRYNTLVDNLVDLVKDPRVCRTLMLIAIFSNESIASLGEDSPFAKVAKKLLYLARRSLVRLEEGEERSFGKFKARGADIKELSGIMQNLALSQI